jgi:Fe-S cluster assembly scaffold protein SufB
MGNLDIPPHLKGVQSSQLSQNLLLDPTARAESIPNLEVKASNVNCVHGATVGELDEEQIYFLRSRGLTEGESKRLLWEGFLNSILDQIFEEEEKNKMMPLWSQKLWRSK